MNQIKEVYSRVHADESAVDAAIIKAKEQKITRFPVGRVAAIAAGFVVVMIAVAIAIFALQPKIADRSAVMSREADAGAAEERAAEQAADDYADLAASIDSVEVVSAKNAAEELTVEYVIKKESGYTPESITLSVEDENQNSVALLMSEAEESDEGWHITARFKPVSSQSITCIFYNGETRLGDQSVLIS